MIFCIPFQILFLNKNYFSDKIFKVAELKCNVRNNKSLYIYGLYRCPSGDSNSFFCEFEQFLNYLTGGQIQFLIIGDFNSNVIRSSVHNTLRLKEPLQMFGLRWSVDSLTRVIANTESAFYNVITNMPNMAWVSTSAVNTSLGKQCSY